MPGIWRNADNTREGKYLVTRRTDGSVLESPGFVIGAKDPAAPAALRAYADACDRLAFPVEYGPDLYRVQRRDGTEPEWMPFVLAAHHPAAATALRAYADAADAASLDPAYAADVRELADVFERACADFQTDTYTDYSGPSPARTPDDVRALALAFEAYREAHGSGDPDAPRHRKDDPATVEKMRSGRSA
jgi:hypothetical protein